MLVDIFVEVLRCTIRTHLGDFEVKVTDLKFCVKVFGLSFYKSISLEHVDGSI